MFTLASRRAFCKFPTDMSVKHTRDLVRVNLMELNEIECFVIKCFCGLS